MFKLELVIQLSFVEIFHIFVKMFSKLHAADLVYVGKGLKQIVIFFFLIVLHFCVFWYNSSRLSVVEMEKLLMIWF